MTYQTEPCCLDNHDLKYIEELQIPVGIYQPTKRGVKTLALSKGFLTVFGLKTYEEAYHLMDHDMYRDTHPDDKARIEDAAINFTIHDATYDVTYRTKKPNTQEWILIRARGAHIILTNQQRVAIVFYQDANRDDFNLTNRLNDEYLTRSIEQKVLYDELTGLPNFTKFVQTTQQIIQTLDLTKQPIALIYADIAGTSTLNSVHGFKAGDKVIQGVANLFATQFDNERSTRPYGDQFVAICPADKVYEKCQKIIEETSKLHDEWTVHIHIGINIIDDPAETIIAACDKAKHAANREKGTHVSTITIFNDDMLEEISKNVYVLSHIHEAMETHQIQVWYQPVINTRENSILEREALARWILPDNTVIPPSQFVPVLENAKTLAELDTYIMQQVVNDLAQRKRNNKPLPQTSINLSRIDFESVDLVDELVKIVDAQSIPHDRICIEITESTAIHDYLHMHRQMRRLHELDFEIWIDDFGSGFSSFDTLQELEFDLLKIDMSLIRALPDSKKSQTMVKSVIDMARRMGLTTLAEGVETDEQASFLIKAGCDKLQGYLYGKPEPVTT